MNNFHYYNQLVNYNLWANKRIAGLLLTLEKSLLDKEVNSSFSSLRKTVYHIWDAEYIWLSRIKGVSLASFPSKTYRNEIEINAFLTCSEEFIKEISLAKDEYFTINCTYKNLQQIEYSNSCAEIIIHCMNHSTYHRGQLVTLLHQLGITSIPSTDYIAFLREEKTESGN